jgi:hypothetical protein
LNRLSGFPAIDLKIEMDANAGDLKAAGFSASQLAVSQNKIKSN